MDYRIQILVRRKSQPVFSGDQFKTEDFESLEDLQLRLQQYVEETIYDDMEGRDDDDQDEPDR